MENQVDPWCGNGNGSTKSTEDTDDNKKGFKDDFVVEPFDVQAEVPERLPDHEEYLNTLETKLAKLGTKSSISKELALRKSDEARRMLESSAAAIELFQDEDLDEKSAISRRLFPEKQALTVSEIAQLLESDVLDKSSQKIEENDSKASVNNEDDSSTT